MALLAAAEAGLEVHQYLPMHVKQAATGYGHADKGQVERDDPAPGRRRDGAGRTPRTPPTRSRSRSATSATAAPRAAPARRSGSTRAAWTAFAARAGK